MTAPCREQVAAAVEALLEALPITGLTVDRERAEPVSGEQLPFLALSEEGHVPQPDFTGEDGFTLTIVVQGLASGANPKAARQAASILEANVLAAMQADLSLGGLVRNITPESETRPVTIWPQCDNAVSGFALAFTIDYATAEGDPFTFA